MVKNFTLQKKIFLFFSFIAIVLFNITTNAQVIQSVKGLVKSSNENIESANVLIQNLNSGAKSTTITNKRGIFNIAHLPAGKYKFTVSSVGFEPAFIIHDIKDQETFTVTIVLKKSNTNLNEVVINTGIVKRKKESFTGAVSTFSGKELKAIGNGNILQSLKTLDPSFIMTPNNNLGSNPNALPTIQVRGSTSLDGNSLTTNSVKNQFSTDPNQPLFILNGMESRLQQIVNLDINRVASITLLKDASSTSLYGSKAANGVIVVETIKPKPGELRINYSVDFRADIPNLNVYHMLNSAGNLEFQKLSGLYIDSHASNESAPSINQDNLYNNRMAAVQSGVNSYWLNAPLRKQAITQGHFLSVSGGSSEFQYDVGLNYKVAPGVMKGSDKNTWGGNVDLYYRKNNINVTNETYINGSTGNDSPYGSFKDYVNLNPYYKKYNADGSFNTNKYFETYEQGDHDSISVPNPLYNAFLNSESKNKTLSLQNTLNLIWDISSDLRFSSGLMINKSNSTYTSFIPSTNTQFDGLDVYNKGEYIYQTTDPWGYQGNVAFTYNKVVQDKHSITGTFRAEATQQSSTQTSYIAVGFPNGVSPNPAFAYGYYPASKPNYSEIKTRGVNALASINYVYNRRYYIDGNFRIDGSTIFGSQKKYTPFWSVGLGWTLNSEVFLKDVSWISLLKIRGNIGTTGNQQLGTFLSSSVYNYESAVTGFGQGFYLNQLGTPNLAWQSTRQISTGIDAGLFKNRLSATFNAYQKVTDPLIVPASAPASVGVKSYALNAGSIHTKGIEATIRFSPIYKTNENIIWTLGVTGSLLKSKYAGFNNILQNANNTAKENQNNSDNAAIISNYLLRFKDGYSPNDLWAVKSLGIDPTIGQEVYQKKNGEHTLIYDPDDEVAIGSASPRVEGVLSSNLNIKGFTLGINIRYSIGQYVLNNALYNKVENITTQNLIYNQDVRALQSRWKQPGDIAQFRGIEINSYTPLSSRFIQKENFFSGESINVGFELQSSQYRWIQALKLSTLRLTAYMNDIFRLSNIQIERGIDYPFANTISFSLNAYF